MMKTATFQLNTLTSGLKRFFLAALTLTLLSAGVTSNVNAQATTAELEQLLVTALDPVIQALDDAELLDEDLLPGDPEGIVAEIVSALDRLLLILTDQVDPADPDNLGDDLEAILAALTTTIQNVTGILDGNDIPGDTLTVLEPIRDLLESILGIVFSIDDTITLPGPISETPADELVVLLQGLAGDPDLDTIVGDLLDDLLNDLVGGLLAGILGDSTTDITTLLITLITETITMVDPPAAAATPSARPDVIAGKRGNQGKGNDVYNRGGGQKFRGKHRVGRSRNATRNFAFTVQNDGVVGDEIKHRGSRNSKTLRVKYRVGGKNRTGAIRSGRFAPTIAAGGKSVVRVQTKAKRRAIRKSNGGVKHKGTTIRLTASGAAGDNPSSDTAKLRVVTRK